MSSVVLANELLDLILDHIDPGSSEGRQSLFACSRANHALQSISQKRIFRVIKVSYEFFYKFSDMKIVLVDDVGTTGVRFLNLITSSTQIASYVTELHIDMLSRRDPAKAPETCSNIEAFSLYAIMPRLTKLSKLAVRSSSMIVFQWFEFEMRTQLFFLGVISLVQELDLRLFDKLPISAFFYAHFMCQACDWNQTMPCSQQLTRSNSNSWTLDMELRLL